MVLSKIVVHGLFGRFDHQIALNKNERVTIMIAPNGFGKTMILRIINFLFNRQLQRLRTMPFEELCIEFHNGCHLKVTRTAPPAGAAKKLHPVVSVALYKNGLPSGTFVLPEISPDEFPYPLASIDEWVPALDRIAPKRWRNLETGETLSFEDVVERHGHEFPDALRVDTGIPEWFSDLQQSVSIRFVDIERLTSRLSEYDFRRSRRRPRSTNRTVHFHSSELGDKIQQTLAEYGSLSQSLDRTFPARLVNQPHRSELTMAQLREDLEEVENKRGKLIEAGLLRQEHTEWNAPALDIADVDKSRREVLAMFAQDTKEKLGVFDGILAKVETFRRIVNSRFLHKQVAVNEDGIVVTTSDDQLLNLEMLSSGEQHELVLLYGLLFRVSQDALIMIDEPELSLSTSHGRRNSSAISTTLLSCPVFTFSLRHTHHRSSETGTTWRSSWEAQLGGPVGRLS